jgi:FAD/FMN-containing dehydrogenase
MTPAVDVSDLRELEGTLRGRIYLCNSEGYDQARQVWNGMIDKRPLAIVGAAGVADVRATVRFAQARSLPVAIRGGGHNVAGSAVCDDGIVIDLALMRSVRVDPVARRARAEGGVLWREYDHETQGFGLASPGGESQPQASLDSLSAEATVICPECMAWLATTSFQPTS